jgi:hypothetical protein
MAAGVTSCLIGGATVLMSFQREGTGVVTLVVVDGGAVEREKPLQAATVNVVDTNGKVIYGGTTNTRGEYPARPTPLGRTITFRYEKIGYVRKPESIDVKISQAKQRVVASLSNAKGTRAYYQQLGRNIEARLAAVPVGDREKADREELARVRDLPIESQAAVDSGLSANMRVRLAILKTNDGTDFGKGPMSFFVTSVGTGRGADLGGIAGADEHCRRLAQAVGAGNRTWRAYLSTQGPNAVNARDRIGSGPWYNARGDMLAGNVAELHQDTERTTLNWNALMVNERGARANGIGDVPNQHDIITGSDTSGRARSADGDSTCNNYTSSRDPENGLARGQGPGVWLGHADRTVGGNSSWNASHKSAGCSQEALVRTGGGGLFYCFAAD